ncbi:hypothetical protein GGR21_001751 [Dysgonomonas hofstadii]|uniref:Uncharacterized protein n=1 Tax=Dysgonomonas hofstadii TaxID=637886 RepID=A0A840CKG1_9BACT|nr:hypothetical protein [Dysgonomonas hofstadii]MBB4035856.1 hypothetical protein [Dysgonomonas hofstadii]
MKNKKILTPVGEFRGYEDARKGQKEKSLIPISEKEVKAALNRINPDEHTMDRG